MLATARTFALVGIDALPVAVEVDVRRGLPSFTIVGLPDAAVRESRERVRAAIVNAGLEFPLNRITANLAPAHLRKAGPGFDLAIAAALLAASGQLEAERIAGRALVGELALDGAVRPVAGALAMADRAAAEGLSALCVPAHNVSEAQLVGGALAIVPVQCLADVRRIGTAREPRAERPLAGAGVGDAAATSGPDIADLRGQPFLSRALEVCAAGGHSLLVTGPPGAGKSLAARCLPSILPPLTGSERVEVTRIAGASGLPVPPGGVAVRPFRAPHHTISAPGLVGGGSPPRPGEATLAHRGVLFLDELGEFQRSALEALRQPLEDGSVTIARVSGTIELPCRTTLVAAANPCPCGHGPASQRCTCSAAGVRAYARRLSHALADRIDLHVRVEQPSARSLEGAPPRTSAEVRAGVVSARARQADRLGEGCVNAHAGPALTRSSVRLERSARTSLRRGHERLGLSGRGHDRVLRLARTLADLDGGADRVADEHVLEALRLRRGDE